MAWKKVITEESVGRIRELYHTMSDSQIAEHVGCSRRTVVLIRSRYGMTRTRDEFNAIRSEIRKNLIRAERRRSIFGFDQQTNLKVFSNRERNSLKYRLKRKKYRFVGRGNNQVYYDSETIRDENYELKGIKLGLKFESIEKINAI